MTKRSVRPRRRVTRRLVTLAATPIALAALGAGYQTVGEARDRVSSPAPGSIVEVEGHAMHLHCTGSGAPTVVLEAGATGFAQTWTWIQSELSKGSRVCSYDRAGLGWSEPRPGPRHAVAIAVDLRELLTAAGETAPYVLVGHSLGGSLIQVYTGLYPDDVLALGMVDPSHPDQLDRFGADIRKQQSDFHSMIGLASKLAHLGVIRMLNPLGRFASGLPDRDYRTARMFAASPGHLRTSHAELLAWDATMAAARRVSDFGDRPVVVLSATANMPGMPDGFLNINHAMHAELAGMSTRGQHVKVPGADHYTILMSRDGARQTAAILERLVEEASQYAEERASAG